MIPIAKPLANDNLVKLINETIELIDKPITGVKACQKHILNKEKGVLVLTGDTSPIDLITHLPALCEENNAKYVFVETRQQLKGQITCCFILKDKNLPSTEELYKMVIN